MEVTREEAIIFKVNKKKNGQEHERNGCIVLLLFVVQIEIESSLRSSKE